ncbi:uncharacterized protein FOMMEDRAFT_166098 [Fomitiporia mediterranea MF3/22]|uniref:uncharacterized protein n=1 Tax=Fomitiporia mediterranea (strain MF3/22) TaxID=694068 RepID=UPI0004407EC1|nr:uncharacterized protein FOMMEDRAFT_166098 [Fomitiporia mediterranea MF3/22]EJD05751.1 hypothetical protein FOMMEDRAFT_166098 [Fomitiporia mediterranea MF3/22]
MESRPLKERIGPPSVEQSRKTPSSVVEEEREGGEISDRESSRSRGARRDRSGGRDRDIRSRDDVYRPALVIPRDSYTHEDRDWNRNQRYRGTDRDEREWARDPGRARHFRDERGGWRDERDRDRDFDRGREGYYETDRDRRYRDSRGSFDNNRDRDWGRDDRIRDRDRDRRYPEDNRSSYSRRPDPDIRYRSPPRHARARSPPTHNRRYSRSPSPRFSSHGGRDRSFSRPRDEGGSRYVRRRDDSVESRRSGPRRSAYERDQPSRAYRKRERSNSPDELRGQRRRQRSPSRSRSPVSRRRSPSPPPPTSRREEKQPERRTSSPPRSAPPPKPLTMIAVKDHRGVKVSRQGTSEEFAQIPKDTYGTTNAPERDSTTPARVEEKPALFDATRRSLTGTPVPRESPAAPSPIPRVAIPHNAPTGPRSAAAQPQPARLPEIPELQRRRHGLALQELEDKTTARMSLYQAFARANAAARRAKTDAELAAIELRSAEYRRAYAEQQRERALEA